ncbi:MAG: type II secretion system protein GspM [Sphingomonadales bacterium]
MNINLTPRESRMAALAVLVALIVLAYVAVIGPIISAYTDYENSLSDMRHRLTQYTRIAAQRPQLAEQLDDLAKHPPSSRDFLTGNGDAIVAANLQRLVTQIIRRSRGRLISTQVLKPSSEEGLRKIALSVQFEGDIRSLQQILFAIESGKPVMFIEMMDIRLNPAGSQQGRQSNIGPSVLRARLDLYGYQSQAAESKG